VSKSTQTSNFQLKFQKMSKVQSFSSAATSALWMVRCMVALDAAQLSISMAQRRWPASGRTSSALPTGTGHRCLSLARPPGNKLLDDLQLQDQTHIPQRRPAPVALVHGTECRSTGTALQQVSMFPALHLWPHLCQR